MIQAVVVLPIILLGLLFMGAGVEVYTKRRLAARGAVITGKKAQARGLLLALNGLIWVVDSLLYFGGYIAVTDVFNILLGTIIMMAIVVILLVAFYHPREW